MRNKAIACLGAIVACATALAGIPATAMADDSAGLTPQYTYNSQNDNGMTFEKVSHADQGLSQADGVVDYTGDGTIAPYTAGLSTTGNGDRGQSYSYAAASSGDWVYIGTMYGGLGVQAILNRDMTSLGLTSKQATALIQTMYAGNMYLGEPDGKSAGGMLFKFNVKTGKTKILMSKSTGIDGGKGVIPTFRSAFKMNGKLYFEGMVMDTNNKDLTQQEIQTAMAYQNGFPCIYEVDPANNDKLTKVYDSVDVDGFRSLVKGNVFTSTRAIGSFGNTLIAGDLKPTADGKGKALLVASKTPSDPNSYKVIADMASFDNLPAIHRQDVNGGGGIYQVQEFNGKLYVVVCTGDTSTLNKTTASGKKNEQKIKLTGVYDSGDEDNGSLYIASSTAQVLADLPDSVDKIEVKALTTPENDLARKAAANPAALSQEEWETWYCTAYPSSIAYQIEEVIPGAVAKQVRQVAALQGNVLQKTQAVMILMTVLSLIAAAVAVANLMVASIGERSGELALLKALGATDAAVSRLMLAETAAISLLGAIVGALLGSGVAQLIGRVVFGSGITMRPMVFALVFVLLAVTVLLASASSIRSILNLKPAEVLHGR